MATEIKLDAGKVAVSLIVAVVLAAAGWVWTSQGRLQAAEMRQEATKETLAGHEEQLDFYGDVLTEHERKAEWCRDQVNIARHELGLPPVARSDWPD